MEDSLADQIRKSVERASSSRRPVRMRFGGAASQVMKGSSSAPENVTAFALGPDSTSTARYASAGAVANLAALTDT